MEYCASRTGTITFSKTWTELRNDCTGSVHGSVIVPISGHLQLCRLHFRMKSDSVDGRGLAWVNLRGSALRNGDYIACVGSYQMNGETIFDEAVDIDTNPGGTVYVNVCLDGGDPGSALAAVSLWWSDDPAKTRQNISIRSPPIATGNDSKFEQMQSEIKRMLRLMEKQVFKEEDKKKMEDIVGSD